MSTKLILVRHAKSAPDKSLPEPQWPLSDVGAQQARDLIEQLRVEKLYASPFLRAVESLRPTAEHLNKDIEIVDDLRERHLADGQLDDWRVQLEQSWIDFDRRLPGGESSRECQQRVVRAVNEIARLNPNRVVAACSHGNAIALFLNSIDPSFGFAEWQRMENPHLFFLEYASDGWAYATA